MNITQWTTVMGVKIKKGVPESFRRFKDGVNQNELHIEGMCFLENEAKNRWYLWPWNGKESCVEKAVLNYAMCFENIGYIYLSDEDYQKYCSLIGG